MSSPISVNERADRNAGYAFILIFTLMAVGIAVTGYIHYQNYEQKYRYNVESQLSSIAELKVDELALWRKERLGDGAVLFKNAAFSALVRRYLEKPEDADAQGQLQAWMGKYTTAYQYARVALYDTQGIRRMSAPEAPPGPVDSNIPRNVTAILRGGQVVLQDFHRYTPDHTIHRPMPDYPIHLSVVVPIFDERDDGRPLGVLALRINPTTYLYPFITRWPTPSQTAETLLVRRDGDDALFLNEIRFHKDAALNLRVPLTKTEVPAVMAALGQAGIVEGMDYNGAPVVANVSAIPDSPWYMVSKMETSELYAPVRERLWQTLALVGFLLLGAGAAMVLIWRQMDARYRERDKANNELIASQGRLSNAQRIAHLGDWEMDIQTGEEIWSDETYRIFGFEPGAVKITLGKFMELVHPEDRNIFSESYPEILSEKLSNLDFEFRIIRPDGEGRVIYAQMEVVTGKNGKPVKLIGINLDITERKLAEDKLRRSENLMAEAQRVARIGHWEWDIRNNVVAWSDEMFRILGHEPGSITPSMDVFMDSVPSEERARVERMIKQSLDGKSRYFMDRVAVMPDGAKRIVHAEGEVERDESGAPFRMFAVVQDVTENKLMEERLQTSQVELKTQNEELLQTQEELEAARAKYFDLYNLAPVGYFTISGQGLVLEANLTAANLLGVTRNLLVNTPFTRLIVPDDQDTYYLFRKKLFETGESQTLEARMARQDGSLFWAHLEATVAGDTQSQAPAWHAVISDISERKQAELKAYSLIRRNQILMQNALEGIHILDEQGNLVEANDSFCRHLGYTMEEALKLTLFDWEAKFSADELRMRMKEFLESHGVFESVHRRKDGSLIDVEVSVVGVELDGRKYVYATNRDITERKKAENRMKLFHDVLDLSSDAVLIMDGETARPVDFNRAAHEQLGYTREEMPDLSILDIIVTEPGSFIWKDRVKQVKESGGLIVERNHRRKDGSVFPVETALTVVEMEGKDYLVAVARDLTEKVKIRELEITAKGLEIANRDLAEFAHVASHDLQEPLRTIIAFSDRLEAKFGAELSPKSLDYLRRIRYAGVRMSQLLQDLLSYSLVSGGHLNFERVELNQVVTEVLEDLRGAIEESGAILSVGPLPVVNADPSQMRQIFQNLISNAIKYRKPGGHPNIKVSGIKTPVWNRGAMWEVVVEDDGIGFDNEYAGKIFKLFERLHGHSEYDGTGVGLATALKIVQRHGWTIKAEGEPGVGAKFTILMISLEE